MKEYISWSMTALCWRTSANIDCIGLRTFSLMFLSHPSTDVFGFLFHWCLLLTTYNFESKRNDCCLPNVLCCDDSVPQNSALIGTKDHSLKINEIKRSIKRIKRDQKIKDQAASRINGSKFIRDQRSTRSKIMKINWRSSSFRSEIKSSKFNFSQIRSLIRS